jgi:hypothetical protein
MPLTLTLTEGALPAGSEKVAFARLSDAMLKWHGLTGNAFLTPNVVGSINLISEGLTFSGSKSAPIVFIEWKVPSFAFATSEVQAGYFAEATDIVVQLSGGKQPKENIWINVVHAVDGAWGIAGKAMTNADLGAAAALG